MTSVAVVAAAAYFAALAARRTDAAHILRQKLLAERVLGVIRLLEASDHCQKLLNVLVEGRTQSLFLCDTRWRRNGCNAGAGAEALPSLG